MLWDEYHIIVTKKTQDSTMSSLEEREPFAYIRRDLTHQLQSEMNVVNAQTTLNMNTV